MSKPNEPSAPLTGAQASPRPAAKPGAARPRASKGAGKSRAGKGKLSAASLLGLSIALVTLALDQATKLYTLFAYELPIKEPVALGPFVNLIVVWNHGISYGLFQQNTELGRWGLIVVSIMAAICLTWWIRRTSAKLLAASLGLIVGGAIGNVIDRLAYGAVFDFIELHAGSWSWYVFNVADAAIVAGVVGLLYDSFVLEGRRAK
jgi:signal peptidase II